MLKSYNPDEWPNVKAVEELCEKFHLKGSIYNYKTNDKNPNNGFYIIAGYDNPPDDFDPQKFINKTNAYPYIYFIDRFVLKIDNIKDISNEKLKLTSYLKDAEFIKTMFEYHDMEAPSIVEYGVIEKMVKENRMIYNEDFFINTEEFIKNKEDFIDILKDDADFYKKINPDNEKKGLMSSIKNAFNKNPQYMKISDLLDCSESVSTYKVYESFYKTFQEKIKDYPSVKYAAHPKEVIEADILDVPKGVVNPYEKHGMNQEKQEFRRIVFRTSDKDLIASCFYNILYSSYQKTDDILNRITKDGDKVDCIAIDYKYLNDFINVCNYNKIPFFVDIKGEYSKPSLDLINICLPKSQMENAKKILEYSFNSYLEKDKSYLEEHQLEWLDKKINKATKHNTKSKQPQNTKGEKSSWMID